MKIGKMAFLLVSTIIFIFSLAQGARFRPSEMAYCSGFVDNGKIISTTIVSHTGFEERERNSSFSGSIGIPRDMEVIIRLKAHAGSGEKIYIMFRDAEGNIIYEESHATIEFTKVVKTKKGKWDFEINGKDIKSGDFRFSIVEH